MKIEELTEQLRILRHEAKNSMSKYVQSMLPEKLEDDEEGVDLFVRTLEKYDEYWTVRNELLEIFPNEKVLKQHLINEGIEEEGDGWE